MACMDCHAGSSHRMRGRGGSFDRALETYRALRAVPGVQAYVGTTVGPDNRDALDALLAGKTPPVELTNPIGCNVKWEGMDAHWIPEDACDLV